MQPYKHNTIIKTNSMTTGGAILVASLVVLFPLWMMVSPFLALASTVHLMTACNAVTTADIVKNSPIDAVMCNLTLALPDYNLTANNSDIHTTVPCSKLSMFGQARLQVVTNHMYQHASCLKPVLSIEDTYILQHANVEFIQSMSFTYLAAFFIMFLIVVVNPPGQP